MYFVLALSLSKYLYTLKIIPLAVLFTLFPRPGIAREQDYNSYRERHTGGKLAATHEEKLILRAERLLPSNT